MIRRFLDCSSGHLSPETWAWLDTHLADDALRDPVNRISGAIAGGRTRRGWFVYTADDQDEIMPEDLRQVCALACRQHAEYVLSDCDAQPDQDLTSPRGPGWAAGPFPIPTNPASRRQAPRRSLHYAR